MSDYDLMEMAAKAVGYEVYGFINGKCIVDFDTGVRGEWSPLDNNGEALRLALDLDIDIQNGFNNEIMVIYDYPNATFEEAKFREIFEKPNGIDKYAAARRAIVKAAADIGQNKR